MKKALLFLLLFSAGIALRAQNYSITPGKEFSPPNDSKWGGYAGENSNSVFLFRFRTKGKGNRYFIECIDKKTLQKQYETELLLEDEAHVPLDPNYIAMRTFCLDDKVYICFSGYDKDQKLNKYFIKTMDANGHPGAMTEVLSTTDKFTMICDMSDDKTKLLLVAELPWANGKQNTLATLFDASNMQKKWSKQLPDEYKDSKIETYYYNIDNNGTLSFLYNYIADAEKKQLGIGVGFMASNAQKAKMYVLPNEKNHSIENGRTMVANDKFIFTGLFKENVTPDASVTNGMSKKEQAKYTAELERKKRAGIFSYLVDMNTGAVKTQFEFFPDDVAKKLDYAQGLVTAGAGNKFYTASQLVTMNNDFYLFENHKYTISGDNVVTYEREFIVTRITSKGEISWTKIFPKNTAGNLNTFNVMTHDNSVYAFYLEHPKNLKNSTIDNYDPTKYADIKNYNGSIVVGLEINPDGTATRKQVYENDGWCYDPQPFNILLEKDNSLMLRMINHGDERFDVIRIQ